jgi:chorismate mutase
MLCTSAPVHKCTYSTLSPDTRPRTYPMTQKPDQRIINLRNAIDTVDSRIIELLQERSSLAREIGSVKKEIGMEILDPSREGKIRKKLASGTQGPMDTDALVRIYEVIMAESRRLQKE